MTPLRGIQAVAFDVGGTLIEPWPSVGHVYAEVAARRGFKNLSAEGLNRRFAAAWRVKREFDHSPDDWAEIVDRTFAGFVPQEVTRSFFPELYERFAEASAWRIYDDVLPILATLGARGFKLGVISNWDGRLRPLLQRLGLSSRFDSIVVSCEVGCSKPSGEIFQQAARELGVAGRTILHVGDSLEMDVQGARSVGWHAVQIVLYWRGGW